MDESIPRGIPSISMDLGTVTSRRRYGYHVHETFYYILCHTLPVPGFSYRISVPKPL